MAKNEFTYGWRHSHKYPTTSKPLKVCITNRKSIMLSCCVYFSPLTNYHTVKLRTAKFHRFLWCLTSVTQGCPNDISLYLVKSLFISIIFSPFGLAVYWFDCINSWSLLSILPLWNRVQYDFLGVFFFCFFVVFFVVFFFFFFFCFFILPLFLELIFVKVMCFMS